MVNAHGLFDPAETVAFDQSTQAPINRADKAAAAAEPPTRTIA